jgi:hypothetical protein
MDRIEKFGGVFKFKKCCPRAPFYIHVCDVCITLLWAPISYMCVMCIHPLVSPVLYMCMMCIHPLVIPVSYMCMMCIHPIVGPVSYMCVMCIHLLVSPISDMCAMCMMGSTFGGCMLLLSIFWVRKHSHTTLIGAQIVTTPCPSAYYLLIITLHPFGMEGRALNYRPLR